MQTVNDEVIFEEEHIDDQNEELKESTSQSSKAKSTHYSQKSTKFPNISLKNNKKHTK